MSVSVSVSACSSVRLSVSLSVYSSVRLSLYLFAQCLYFSLKECNINQRYIRFKRYVMAACGYKSFVECLSLQSRVTEAQSERRYQQEKINSSPHVAMYPLVPNMTEY